MLVETAGDLTGKALIQFQCSTGEETISWAILGETATGLDISDIQVGLAREKAKEAGVDATFVHGDVMVLPDEIAYGRLASLDFRLDRRSRRRLPEQARHPFATPFPRPGIPSIGALRPRTSDEPDESQGLSLLHRPVHDDFPTELPPAVRWTAVAVVTLNSSSFHALLALFFSTAPPGGLS